MFGMNMQDILNSSDKIQAFIPQIKKFIPQLIDAQKQYSGKQNLKQGEFLLYSLALSPVGKIFIYGFKCESAKDNFKINDTTYNKGCVIIKQELFKIELTQYLDVVEKNGLMGLLQVIPMESLTGFIK